MPMERLQTYPIICEGGLNSNENFLQLSMQQPGCGTTLVNYESSLFGGYRKLDGFAPLVTNFAAVDDAGSEGKILGIAIYDEGIIVARKQKASTVYRFFFWTPAANWTAYATGLTLTVTNLNKIRHDTFNFSGDEIIVFADGINNATMFNGTNWTRIDPADTGADFANAGGNQALDNPKYVTVFKGHVFVAGDSTDPQVVAHSAPNEEYDWNVAAGAGQLNVGFEVVQLKPFRDELYVFGKTRIKKIVVEESAFVVKDVTKNIGCLASDSVVEVNTDLVFLSQDGFRTVAATDKIGDTELSVLSKSIQQDVTDLISSNDLSQVDAVVVRRKSQVRFFFNDDNTDADDTDGIIGCVRGFSESLMWEWGKLRGIRTSCTTSGYIDDEEYVLHGDYNGKVYRQESGNSFDGSNILTVYTTPYLDFGEIYIRKTIHKITVFLRPEAETTLSTAMQFDWDSSFVFNPGTYTLESDVTGTVYGTAVYGTGVYASRPVPVIFTATEGSGFSVRLTFTTNAMAGSHSIQAIVFEYMPNGRK